MNFIHTSDLRSSVREHDPDTAVLWVFRDYDELWCMRREGAHGIKTYACRADAVEAARLHGRASGSYRLFLQLKDGRMMQELMNPEPVADPS